MTLSDGRVLSPQQGTNRTSDNITSSENNGVFTREGDTGLLEEEHTSCGSTGGEERSGSSGGKESYVVGVESGVCKKGMDSVWLAVG